MISVLFSCVLLIVPSLSLSQHTVVGSKDIDDDQLRASLDLFSEAGAWACVVLDRAATKTKPLAGAVAAFLDETKNMFQILLLREVLSPSENK